MKTHPTDLLSFIPGVVSIAVAVVALSGALTLDLLATGWVWPAILIGLGLVVLASAGIGRREPVVEPDAGEHPVGTDAADGDTSESEAGG